MTITVVAILPLRASLGEMITNAMLPTLWLAVVGIIIMALYAPAAESAEWNGPGANPCNDQCPIEWALDEIAGTVPPPVLAEWRVMHAASWRMETMSVRDGDEILAMGEGGPHMIRRPMEAALDHWEPARGWLVMHDGDAWLFMIIRACQNPVVIVRRAIKQPPLPDPVVIEKGPTAHSNVLRWSGPRDGGWTWTPRTDTPHLMDLPRRTPVDVPAPSGLWLLTMAVLVCVVAKGRGLTMITFLRPVWLYIKKILRGDDK